MTALLELDLATSVGCKCTIDLFVHKIHNVSYHIGFKVHMLVCYCVFLVTDKFDMCMLHFMYWTALITLVIVYVTDFIEISFHCGGVKFIGISIVVYIDMLTLG